ncbi:MAG: hypothetical protein OHK0048_10880 [Rhodoferax sp.]
MCSAIKGTASMPTIGSPPLDAPTSSAATQASPSTGTPWIMAPKWPGPARHHRQIAAFRREKNNPAKTIAYPQYRKARAVREHALHLALYWRRADLSQLAGA